MIVHAFEVVGPDESWSEDPVEIMLGDVVVFTCRVGYYETVARRDEYAINQFALALAAALDKGTT